MTALHDMTAGELLANYKAKKLSPVEAVDAVIAHIETWEPKLKALYAPDFEGARKAAKASEKRWQAGKPQGGAGRRAHHHQGEHRHQGRAGAARHRGDRPGAGGGRRAGLGPGARGGRRHPRQDHHARLRHAVVGAKLVPSADPQSLEPRLEPGRLERRRRRGRGGRLRSPASRHRHRRLGAPAGLLERHLHAEAQPRPRAGRSAVLRPRRRADDAHGGRLRPAAGRTVEARRARPHEPAAGRHRLERGPARTQGPQDRPASRRGLGPAGRCRGEGRGRGRGQEVRRRRRQGRAGGAVPVARHAASAGPVLARAQLGRLLGAEPRQAGERAALHRRLVPRRRRRLGHHGDQGRRQLHGDPCRRDARHAALRLRAVAGLAGADLSRRMGDADQRRPAAAGAHLLHHALQHERAAGRLDQLRLHQRRQADRPADRRPPLRRSRA